MSSLTSSRLGETRRVGGQRAAIRTEIRRAKREGNTSLANQLGAQLAQENIRRAGLGVSNINSADSDIRQQQAAQSLVRQQTAEAARLASGAKDATTPPEKDLRTDPPAGFVPEGFDPGTRTRTSQPTQPQPGPSTPAPAPTPPQPGPTGSIQDSIDATRRLLGREDGGEGGEAQGADGRPAASQTAPPSTDPLPVGVPSDEDGPVTVDRGGDRLRRSSLGGSGVDSGDAGLDPANVGLLTDFVTEAGERNLDALESAGRRNLAGLRDLSSGEGGPLETAGRLAGRVAESVGATAGFLEETGEANLDLIREVGKRNLRGIRGIGERNLRATKEAGSALNDLFLRATEKAVRGISKGKADFDRGRAETNAATGTRNPDSLQTAALRQALRRDRIVDEQLSRLS